MGAFELNRTIPGRAAAANRLVFGSGLCKQRASRAEMGRGGGGGLEERSEGDTEIGTLRDWTLNEGSRKALERPILGPWDQLSPQDIFSEGQGKDVCLRTSRVLEPALEGTVHRGSLSGLVSQPGVQPQNVWPPRAKQPCIPVLSKRENPVRLRHSVLLVATAGYPSLRWHCELT